MISIILGYSQRILIPNQQNAECPLGVATLEVDYGFKVIEFELQSRYKVHFQTNNPRIDMRLLILPVMG